MTDGVGDKRAALDRVRALFLGDFGHEAENRLGVVDQPGRYEV
jgi:hypothetical protein